MTDNYDDIINLPHHVSTRHPAMPMHDRAAQFAPFAALTGHGAAIQEAGRLTDTQRVLEDYENGVLNQKVNDLLADIKQRPALTITYFRPDARKAGGAYVTVSGVLHRYDEQERTLLLADGTLIPLSSIVDLARQ